MKLRVSCSYFFESFKSSYWTSSAFIVVLSTLLVKFSHFSRRLTPMGDKKNCFICVLISLFMDFASSGRIFAEDYNLVLK